jgi:hypothetical protein
MLERFDPNKIQYLAIAGSTALALFITELIRRRRLRENYSLMWLFMTLMFLLFSLWRQGLELLARLLGIAYPPTAFLLLLVIGIFLILVQFSIITSDLTDKVRRLAQEIGLLKERLDRMENGGKGDG